MAECIDITTPAFAHRLANLLTATRHRNRCSLRSLARASEGQFQRVDLQLLEQARYPLDGATIDLVAELYGCDIEAILPPRLPIVIDGSVLRTGGVEVGFSARSDAALLDAYLQLVRSLRGQRTGPVVVLRTDDIEVLADHLHTDRETVAGWLLARMNAAPVKRTALAGMLATGAVVVGLVGTAAAVDDDPAVPVQPGAGTAATVVVVDNPDDPRDGEWFLTAPPVEAIVAVGEPPVPVVDDVAVSQVPLVGVDDPSLAPVEPEMSTGDEAPPVPAFVDETSSDDAPPQLEPEMSTGDEPPPLP